MKVNTKTLRSMLGRVSACKPTNLLEITNYYELEFTQDGLNLNATDGTNYMTVTDDTCKTDNPISIIVKGDQFTKLINKTTTDDVDLIVKGSYLQVVGNGVYKVEIVEDEIYPKFKIEISDSYKVSLDDMKRAINGGKYAKSGVPNDGVLFSFLLRDNELTTADAIKVYNKSIEGAMGNLSALISPSLANMVMSIDVDDVEISVNAENTLIMFMGDNVVVGGAIVEGAEEYPDLSEMFNAPYPYTVEVDTQLVLQAIDRLGLFVSIYDKGIIDIVFTSTGITLATSSKSHETIPFVANIDPLESDATYMVRVNCKYLQDIFNAIGEPSVFIEFGEDDIIKFVTTDTTMLLATADEE